MKVSTVDPGMVETEFSVVRFHGDADRASKVYEGMQALTADDITETVVWVADRPRHVQVAEMVIEKARRIVEHAGQVLQLFRCNRAPRDFLAHHAGARARAERHHDAVTDARIGVRRARIVEKRRERHAQRDAQYRHCRGRAGFFGATNRKARKGLFFFVDPVYRDCIRKPCRGKVFFQRAGGVDNNVNKPVMPPSRSPAAGGACPPIPA